MHENESLYKKGPSVEHFPWPEIPNISQDRGNPHRSLFLPMAETRVNHAHCRSWSWYQRSSCFKDTTTSLSPPYKLEPKWHRKCITHKLRHATSHGYRSGFFFLARARLFSRCRVIAGGGPLWQHLYRLSTGFLEPPKKAYKSTILALCAPF